MKIGIKLVAGGTGGGINCVDTPLTGDSLPFVSSLFNVKSLIVLGSCTGDAGGEGGGGGGVAAITLVVDGGKGGCIVTIVVSITVAT